MKLIGLLGGMSWESTTEYYRIINEEINRRLGGHTSANLLLYSLNIAETLDLQAHDEWDEVTNILVKKALKLQEAGAEAIVICTNTKHIVADRIQQKIAIPIIHIVKETAKKVKEKNIKKVGLLGTIYTMEKPLYRDIFKESFGIAIIVPDQDDRQMINDIIYNELQFGNINQKSKEFFFLVIAKLVENGAEGIILGCTEIPLVIKQEDVNIPVFNTTMIHALAAVDFMLS